METEFKKKKQGPKVGFFEWMQSEPVEERRRRLFERESRTLQRVEGDEKVYRADF